MINERLLEKENLEELVEHIYGEVKVIDFGGGPEPYLPVDISIDTKNKLVGFLWILEDPDFPEISIYDYEAEKLYELDEDGLIDTGIIEIRLGEKPGTMIVNTSHAGERSCAYDLETLKFIWNP